jgi:hypothetical protein
MAALNRSKRRRRNAKDKLGVHGALAVLQNMDEKLQTLSSKEWTRTFAVGPVIFQCVEVYELSSRHLDASNGVFARSVRPCLSQQNTIT